MVRTFTIKDAPQRVQNTAKRRLNRYFDTHDISEYAPMVNARDKQMHYIVATTPDGRVRLYIDSRGEVKAMLQNGEETPPYLEGFGYDTEYEPAG